MVKEDEAKRKSKWSGDWLLKKGTPKEVTLTMFEFILSEVYQETRTIFLCETIPSGSRTKATLLYSISENFIRVFNTKLVFMNVRSGRSYLK